MYRPLNLFRVQEWGTHRLEGHVCPKCGEARLVPQSHPEDASEKTPLVCSSCLETYPPGWFRHFYAQIPPLAIRGQVIHRGPLFSTIQHWSRVPDGDPDQPHLADFYLDIDRPDFEDALQVAQSYARLFESNHVPYRVGFSGKKGFWLQVPWQSVGASPMPYLHERVYRHMAWRLHGMTGETPDMQLYSNARLFRVPGTRHAGSGLFKIGIPDRHDLPNARVLAEKPQNNLLRDLGKDLYPVPFLHELFLEAQVVVHEQLQEERKAATHTLSLGELQEYTPCITRALQEGPPAQGTRNILNRNMAAFFRDGDDEKLITWAKQVRGSSETPGSIRVSEMRSTLRWARRSNAKFSCREMQKLELCDPQCAFYPLSHRFHEVHDDGQPELPPGNPL